MLSAGTEIRGYRIERLIGHGGMGEVYEATQHSLDRTVALKILHTRLSADPEFQERFRREGRLQAGLDHPNVVPVFEAGALDDGLYIAMKLIRGRTLKDLIVGGELDDTKSLAILTQIADALDTAHATGIVHRDIKPQNILVEDGGRPYLADFGLTRETQETSALTRTGQFQGTIDYVSPEQVRGEPADASSDIYSLTAVTYECLTGNIPFPRSSDAAVLYAHVNDAPPALSDVRPELPRSADAVIARGLAKEREERFESADELADALAEALGASPAKKRRWTRRRSDADTVVGGVGSIGDPGSKSAPAKRKPIALAGALAGTLVLAGAAFALGKSGGSDAEAAQLPATASSDALVLSLPEGWQRTDPGQAVTIPGYSELRDGIAASPSVGDGSGIVSGLGAAADASLLPPELIEAAGEELPAGKPVSLGESSEALFYEDVGVAGFDRPLDIYAVPNTAGVANLVCYAPVAGGEAVASCSPIALSMEVNGKPLPISPTVADYRGVEAIAAKLDRRRLAGRQALRRAARPGPQAAAADEIAAAFRDASERFEALHSHPALQAQVKRLAVTASRTTSAYESLAKAIRAQDAGAFNEARKGANQAERNFDRELQVLSGDAGR